MRSNELNPPNLCYVKQKKRERKEEHGKKIKTKIKIKIKPLKDRFLLRNCEKILNYAFLFPVLHFFLQVFPDFGLIRINSTIQCRAISYLILSNELKSRDFKQKILYREKNCWGGKMYTEGLARCYVFLFLIFPIFPKNTQTLISKNSGEEESIRPWSYETSSRDTIDFS